MVRRAANAKPTGLFVARAENLKESKKVEKDTHLCRIKSEQKEIEKDTHFCRIKSEQKLEKQLRAKLGVLFVCSFCLLFISWLGTNLVPV